MTEFSKVSVSRESSSKSAWGKNPFLFSDGRKLSVDKGKLKYAVIGVFLLLSGIQLLFGHDTRVIEAAKPLELADSYSGERQVDLTQVPAPKSGVQERRENRQSKRATTLAFSGPQVVARPRNLSAIPPGTLAEAKLVTGASNGLVRAELTTSVEVGGMTELEPGVVLVGQGNSTAERLMVNFNQAVFPDGSVGSINAHACNLKDKIVGLKGSNVASKALNVAGSIGLGFVGGLAEGLQEAQGQQGAVVRPPTVKNALLNATSQTALEQSRGLMTNLRNQKPLIEVPVGRRICVLFGGAQ